jgi:hypothetical protein
METAGEEMETAGEESGGEERGGKEREDRKVEDRGGEEREDRKVEERGGEEREDRKGEEGRRDKRSSAIQVKHSLFIHVHLSLNFNLRGFTGMGNIYLHCQSK